MASGLYYTDGAGSIQDDDSDEEQEIFSVSGRNGGLAFSRADAKSPGFGAMDDDIELSIDAQEDINAISEQNSRPARDGQDLRRGADPPSYQTDITTTSIPRGSQEGADEIEAMVDKLLTVIGLGRFHLLLLCVSGCGLFFACVQLAFVGSLMPDIARDMCLSDSTTGWLRGSVFIGVILASVLWGCAADLGSRRTSLGVCLAIAGLSMAIAAGFAQSRDALLVFLTIASIGTGGVISIPFAYVFEFLPRRTAQKTACALLAFTVFGAMFVPLVTPAFTSSVTRMVSSGDFSPSTFADWRIFCMVLSLLPLSSAMLLAAAILPRSPHILLEKRLWANAIQTLAKVYSFNHGEAGVEMFKDRANGLYRLKRHIRDRQPPAPSTHLQSCMRLLNTGVKNVTSILDKKTLVMMAGAFSFAFGYCAWTLWMTDFIIADGRRYNASIVANATFSDTTFTKLLEKQIFINTSFQNVTFLGIHLRDLSYTGCSFTECVFENVASDATLFTRCLFVNTRFRNTDFQPPRQFVGGTELVNSSLAAPGVRDRGCSVDVPFAPDRAYWRVLSGHCGGFLGLFLSVLVSRVIETWRLFMCGALITAVTILFGFFPLTGWTAAAHLFCLQFGGFMAWSALTVQAAMSFPTNKRATGLAILVSAVTTGGLLGFVAVVALPKVADVIVTAVAVLTSAACSYFFQRRSQDERQHS
ncbi:synaptic vesicle glycoprotein 2A-like [Patiria miniata]|uniref:Major facilitator superfamily (MFS) profile domain-containing protein n=1 Tax=Patiria miniata TaxID=46514 RepID=A0A914BU52_PATMI|nr:synaptic vesicle glycoprotein 2A-like [Patiria miniata]